MKYNISYDIASLCILAVLAYIYKTKFRQEKIKRRLYYNFINVSVVMCISDIITCFTICFPTNFPMWFIWTINEIYYAATVACGYLFYCYISDSVSISHIKEDIFAKHYFILYLIMCGLNPLTHWFFYFKDGLYYTHGKLFLFSAASPYVLMLVGYFLLIRKNQSKNRKKKILHSVLVITSIAFAVVQNVFPTVLMGALGTVFGAIILLFCFDSPDYHALQKTLKALDRSKKKEELARLTAEKANAEKSQFLANMSHEIRTPLNTIMGLNEMILREGKEENIKEYAIKLKGSADTLLSTVNDILDFSKIESGKLEIVPKEYNLGELIVLLVDMEKERARKQGLEFILDVDKNLPSILYGDDVRVRQIITNLLTNAIKYTLEGSVTFSLHGEINDKDVILKVEVTDTGIGIKEEDLEKLFGEFERIDEERNKNVEGTGLGINITVSLLELMGSKLCVESEYTKGSRFFFELKQKIIDRRPIGEIENAIKSKAMDYTYKASFTAPEASILAIDDTDLNLYVVKQLLKKTKLNITTASSAKEGIELIKNNHYDLILMDHMMPEMDGIEALHIIRNEKLCPDTSVIALTANAITGVEKMYLEEGFAAYISKPINQEELESKIKDNLKKELIQEPDTEEEELPLQKNQEQDTLFDEISRMDIFDIQTALTNTQNKENFLQILEQYQIAYRKNKKNIEDLYEAKDIKNYRIAVHSMKSSSALVGLMKLSACAKRAEEAAREEDTAKIEANFPELLDNLEEVEKVLSKIYEWEKEDSNDTEVNPSIILAILSMLKNALEDFDVDEMDNQMKMLLTQAFPKNLKDLKNKLQLEVTDLDADSALKTVEAMEQGLKEVL